METTVRHRVAPAADPAADLHGLTAHLAALSPTGGRFRVQVITPHGSSRGDYHVECAVNYGKLTVTYWGPNGSACWRVERYARHGTALRLDVSRRVGAERGQLIITSPDEAPDEAPPEAFPTPDMTRWKACVRTWLNRNLPAGVRITSLRQWRHPSPVAGWQAQSGNATWLVFTTTDPTALRQLLGNAMQALDTLPATTYLWLLLPPASRVELLPFLSLLHVPQVRLYEAAPDWSAVHPVAPDHQLPLITEPIRLWRYKPPTPSELDDLRQWFGDALDVHCEVVPAGANALSVRWYGLECARLQRRVASEEKAAGRTTPALRFGLMTLGQPSRPLTARNQADFHALLEMLNRYRTPTAREVGHPLYRAHPERWLDVAVRRQLHLIDEALDSAHIRVQAPHFSRDTLGLADFVTLTRTGRLAVVELKADADADFIWQGLTYWLRAVHHWQNGDFLRRGYFAGAQPDRCALPHLYLLAPTLRFHRTVRAVARRLRTGLPVTLLGVNERWRQSLRVVFRECFGDC
jgi:hypothetical protein